ncbi:unnamed protein product [Rotaria magnacalcarata]|uniref:MULE transposase domain-containing protein n=2 Tax=Rotaria magnacalcarata TaxID=392030 RepID=A0A815L344_9BILA|nr:unnamed protein product [Rotaria magnacalcarata]
MSNKEYQVVDIVNTLNKANAIIKQHQVSKYRTCNLSNSTTYYYRCSQYRKYPLCQYEIQISVPSTNSTPINLTFKNARCHEHRNTTSRLSSPIRTSVEKYVKYNLTQSHAKTILSMDYPNVSLPTTDDLHATFVPYYSINNIHDIFVFFTTKKLISQTPLTTLLKVDATYKLTWNELPLLVFGSSDADRHFHPFAIALVSNDEDSICYKDLFNQLQLISTQENNRPFYINFIMADGAPGIRKAQKDLFPGAKRLMCWAHVIRKCHEHRKLVPKDKWNQIDLDIHDLQLSFSDSLFQCGASLLMKKWSSDTLIKQFQEYFYDQWIIKLPLWREKYEGAGINIPSTNNGCESLNGKIKQQYTLRNELHLSSFLSKIEQMLHDWSTNSLLNDFVTKPSISTTLELISIKWPNSIDKISILHWFDSWYTVPSSNSLIAPAVWLQMYQQQQQ